MRGSRVFGCLRARRPRRGRRRRGDALATFTCRRWTSRPSWGRC